MPSKLPTPDEMRENVAALLDTTRYHPEKESRDKDGMPKVAKEPNDPDDE